MPQAVGCDFTRAEKSQKLRQASYKTIEPRDENRECLTDSVASVKNQCWDFQRAAPEPYLPI